MAHGLQRMGARTAVVIVADDFQFLDTLHGIDAAALEWLLAGSRERLLDLASLAPQGFVVDLEARGLDPLEALQLLRTLPAVPRVILLAGADLRLLARAKDMAARLSLEVLGVLTHPLHLKTLVTLLGDKESSADRIDAAELEVAIDERQLLLHYQPILRRETQDWVVRGAEALVRWRHPTHGLLYPGQFLQLAERSGAMNRLSWWVLDEAIRQAAQWEQAGLNLAVAVNVTPTLACEQRFVERLLDLTREAGLSPAQLTLEIIDLTGPVDWTQLADVFTRLRVQGVGLSLDDFGAGRAAPAGLYRLPCNEIKIDRTLTCDVTLSPEALIVVQGIVELAHRLSIQVCAGGVETAEMHACLVRIGCDALQGVLIARPVPAAQVADAVRRVRERLQSTGASGNSSVNVAP